MSSQNPPASLDTPRLILEYVRVLAWPLILVAVLAVYRPPLGRMLTSLSDKFENANKVSMGSFSIEVAEQAKEVGSRELAADIGQLSASAVATLMATPREGTMMLISEFERDGEREIGLPNDSELNAMRELAEKDLLVFAEPLTEFVNYVRTLPTRPYDPAFKSEREWYTVPPEGDIGRLRRQDYRLTERGRAATEAITRAVAAQLARE